MKNWQKEGIDMKYWQENLDNFEEISDEYLDEGYLEEKLHSTETPDVEWGKHIEYIKDPKIKEKEIQTAARIYHQEENLNERLGTGEITEDQYLREYELHIKHDKKRAMASSALESGNFTPGHLGDIANELHSVSDVVDKAATRKLVERTAETLGADSVQNMADQMMEEGKISKDAYNSLSREVGYYKK